ncbi:hypothetical protein [Nonomuraea sp. NPDC050643]|uniref:hypothetical protein n=1 Tax=Nonomuraea sp. NPDC050643 TaxID=3155660 RepID=UPI0033D3C244
MSRYPRLTEGLAFVPVPEGYIVEGGQRRELLTGRLARGLFPDLLPLLDGTRTLDQIGTGLGLPVAYVRSVVSLLARRDLLRLTEARAGLGGPAPMRTFLRRSFPSARASGIWRRLQASTVAVTGAPPLRDLLVDLLRQSGVGTVDDARATAGLTISVLSGAETTADRPGPLLPVRAGSRAVSIGPLLLPGDPAPPGGPDAGGPDPALAGVTAGVAVGAALRLLGGHGDDDERHRVIDVLNVDGQVRIAARPAGSDPRASGHTASGHAGDVVIPAKWYLTERRLPSRRSPHEPVRAMSWMLGEQHLVPSAAPAGAIRTYLLGDLADGDRAYFVDPAARHLVELTSPVSRDRDGVTLVLTHDLTWLPRTFREPGLRLLYGDTGLALAQVADNARPAGWRARVRRIVTPAHPWPSMGLDLDLDPDRERVAAVVDLTPARPVARPSRRPRLPMSHCFGNEPLDPDRLTRLVTSAFARVREVWGSGPPRCALYTRGVAGSFQRTGGPDRRGDPNPADLEGHLGDRGLSPSAVLLFTTEPDADLENGSGRLLAGAAMAAGTVRLLAARAGIVTGFLARLPERFSLDRRVLYGCALGRPSGGPGDPAPARIVW